MSSPPPTKPPRGVKQGKETSGLLMSVIRTLSASETNEQREKERAKLEKEYKKSDARLDELVAIHAQEITDVMQKFSAVTTALGAWGQHCSAAEARLAACRALLRVRRDDLRRLWADARTHHHALRMLTDIERVVVSEREARELTSSGRVLGAAHSLQAALLTARTELPRVHALSVTITQLEAKKKELVDIIVNRISEAVYKDDRAPLSRRVSARRRTALLLAELTKSEEVTDAYLQDITPEFEASLTEEDKTFETTVMISLEALGVLEQLKEATEKFKVQIQNELLEVIDSVSRRIINDVDIEIDGEEGEEDVQIVENNGEDGESGRPLARLVSCLAEEFKACGMRNKRLLQLWKAALQKHRISEQCLHTEQHYWSAVQQVMQLLLTEYLEIESVNLAAHRAATDVAPDLRLADYFAKKRPQRRRDKLFKLTPAAPAVVSGVTSRRHRYPLVCTPRPALLHAALPALHALCACLERPGGECSLRVFISDYVRWGESERLAQTARVSIDTAVKAPNAWRERVVPADQSRPAFACCVQAWDAVHACAVSARRCGACGGASAARAVTATLGALATHARAAHARLSPAAPARAARWLADDDIVRFLQSLPNYRAAVENASFSPQELKQSYEREAETLGTSLGDGEVSKREIVADINTLVDLALLCESMNWLSTNIKTIPSIISSPSPSGGALKLPEKFNNDISAAAAIFDEIAHKCLLFLHLEMRIECFHYLGGEERGDAEEAGGASRLAQRLLALHERANTLLAPHARNYIMCGIGEMMSSAVVWRWQSAGGGATQVGVTSVSGNNTAPIGGLGSAGGGASAGSGASRGGGGGVEGVEAARLAALRHCLAALSLPHDGLHGAHAYLHLLACTPEEIITSVKEKGPQFSELEYLNAFKVIAARRNIPPSTLRVHLKQLSTALGHVGVTV